MPVSCTLHRAPVGQGPSGPGWLAIAFGFWSGRALATGTTAWAGLCLIHHHSKSGLQNRSVKSVFFVVRAGSTKKRRSPLFPEKPDSKKEFRRPQLPRCRAPALAPNRPTASLLTNRVTSVRPARPPSRPPRCLRDPRSEMPALAGAQKSTPHHEKHADGRRGREHRDDVRLCVRASAPSLSLLQRHNTTSRGGGTRCARARQTCGLLAERRGGGAGVDTTRRPRRRGAALSRLARRRRPARRRSCSR